MGYKKDSEAATALQYSVRSAEIDRVDVYDEDKVRQSIVHAREDIVLICSFINSIDKHIISIKWSVWITTILIAVFVLSRI